MPYPAFVAEASESQTAIRGYLPEIVPTSRLWARPGVDAVEGVKNRIPGQPGLVPLGSGAIDWQPGYATLRGAANASPAYLNTQQSETVDFTWAILFRATGDFSTEATRPVLIGNYNTASQAGSILWVSGRATDGSLRPQVSMRAYFTDGTNNLSFNALLTLSGISEWTVLIATVKEGVGVSLYHPQSGAGVGTSTTRLRKLPSHGLPIHIGNTHNNNFGGPVDVAATVMRAGAAEAAERQAIYVQFLREAAERGLVIS